MRRIVLLSVVVGSICAQGGAADTYRIVERDGGWRLLRNGEPFHIKGAVGWQAHDLLRRSGGNCIRTGANRRGLDQAHEAGLAAMVNLSVRGERNGMNWDDEQRVAQQKERVLQTVRDLKDHPAVMFWSVGNELDWIPPGVPYHPKLWQRLNDIAAQIHAIDPHHPVMTVIGTSQYERKIQEIAKGCADMDLLGINAYGDLAAVAELTRRHWPKPYVVAEWGPTGHWQTPRTAWRVPIEETSTEKARAIFDRYTTVIQADADHCLGSFVFLWAEKQETTHTWYGLFLDGLPTESIDVMSYLWSGSWPQNRAPAVLSLDIAGFSDRKQVYLKPAQTCEAKVTCYDCDYDPLTFKWDIRREVEIPKDSYAGGGEKHATPIPNLIEEGQGMQVRFTTPQAEDAYRLFVQVLDGHGHVGYANAAFYVRQP
jgi:hypothetical protein